MTNQTDTPQKTLQKKWEENLTRIIKNHPRVIIPESDTDQLDRESLRAFWKKHLSDIELPGEKELDHDVQRDAEFIENLCFYDRKALAQMICEMAQNDGTREWIIRTLHVIQEFGYLMNVYHGPVAKMTVMAKISDQVDELTKQAGPSGLNPFSIKALSEWLYYQASAAKLEGGAGNNTAALNEMISLASRAIYGLIYHIQKNPEGVQQTSKQGVATPCADQAENKKADPAATESAEKTNHGNDNRN